jgi:hypothetical protein
MSQSPAPFTGASGDALPDGPPDGQPDGPPRTAPQPPPDGIEARKHRRARAHWPIRLIGGSGNVASGWVWDVSEGGMGLVSTVNMPVGALLQTAVAIPNPKDPRRSLAVQARVRVVFSSFTGTQSRLGVQFLTLPLEVRAAIRTYVLSHS